MRVVIDTNVVVSGTFFGGYPREVLLAVLDGKVDAYASADILEEYQDVIDEMIDRKQGKINKAILWPFLSRLRLVPAKSEIHLCRDPKDDKFLSCAVDSQSKYLVSGDNDLLALKQYQSVEIVKVSDFLKRITW